MRTRNYSPGLTSSNPIRFSKEWVQIYDGGSDTWLYARRVDCPEENAHGLVQFVELIDMWAATGDDSGDRYAAEMCEVDLRTADVKAALDCCGWSARFEADGPIHPLHLAEMVYSYGQKAPLWSDSGNNAIRLLKEARRAANENDPRTGCNILRMMNMQRPVNALGSTAAEYARGDFESAMVRGIQAHDRGAKIMAKMHGATEEEIAKIENP